MHLVNPFQGEHQVSNTQQPLARLVARLPSVNGSATHNKLVYTWEEMSMIMIQQANGSGDYSLLQVEGEVDGQLTHLFERDWSKTSVPTPCDVNHQVVIAFQHEGKLVKVLALRHLRDGVKLEPADSLALKKATARALGVRYELSPQERSFVNEKNAASVPAPAEAGTNKSSAPAAPVKAPQPAPAVEAEVAPATNVKAAMVEAEKAKIAGRELVTVYRKDNGAPLTGKRVYPNETKFLVDGEYVTHNRDDVPVDHFTAKSDAKGKVHRKATVLVSAHIPAHVTAAMSEAASAPHH